MKGHKRIEFIKFLIMFALLFIFLIPFLMIILNTFKTTQKFVDNPISWPVQFNFDNYIQAFDDMNFAMGFVNSIIITVIGVLGIVLFSSMTAYLFARFKWNINKVLFFIMIASMAVPFQVIMIPLVTIYGNIGFLDSIQTLLFMYLGCGVPFAIFTFHGFIKGIPVALEEAAAIDGCSKLRTFFQIVLPLLKPILSTVIVLDVLWIWNDYLLPSLVLLSPELKTLPLSTYNFFSSYSVDFSPLMAGLVMSLIPVLILYLFLQKYIIEGISEGALK
ncbi:MAG TPA: sugar ABC transporter permease [Firmicutes bacterium]|jgi:raffinose/stachyose/melibiose transport system permease protein|nr:sugar ABC transporter permease [Bacillota bacterium]